MADVVAWGCLPEPSGKPQALWNRRTPRATEIIEPTPPSQQLTKPRCPEPGRPRSRFARPPLLPRPLHHLSPQVPRGLRTPDAASQPSGILICAFKMGPGWLGWETRASGTSHEPRFSAHSPTLNLWRTSLNVQKLKSQRQEGLGGTLPGCKSQLPE